MNRTLCTLLSIPVLATSAFGFNAGGIDIHGSVLTTLSYSDEYNYLGKTRKNWDLNNTELTLNGQYRFENGIRVGAQIFAYEIGEIDEITLDWAVVDYSFTQYFGLRAGRMKYQLGLYNNVRDVDAAHTFAILPNAIYNKMQRPFASSIDGIMAYGNVSTGRYGSLDYEVSFGTRPDFRDDGLLEMVGADKLTHDKLYGAGLIWNTPVDGLRLAYSYHFNGPITIYSSYFDPMMDMDVGFTMELEHQFHVISAEYFWNNWKFAAEYQYNRQEMNFFGMPSVTKAESYYVQAAYRVNDWLELGAYYNVEYPNKNDRSGDSFANPDPMWGGMPTPRHQAWTKDLAFVARFDITPNWLIKAEVHAIDGTSRIAAGSANVGNVPAEEWTAKWGYFVLRTTFTF